MFRRRYRVKRYKRRAYRKRGGGLWSLAKKAASGVVKYYLNPEYKFLDNANSLSAPNTGVMVSNMSLIALGDTDSTRNGNSIKATSHLLRYTITKASAATATAIRIILFTDISSDGAVPAVADLLDNASNLSPLSQVNGSRFHILMDRMYNLSADTPIITRQYYRKMNHHIKYLDGTANNTSLGQGPIYMCLISNEGTNTPTVAYQSRIRFLDN